MATPQITTAARRMCRAVNGPDVIPGYIYWVDLATGKVGPLAATYAATQIQPGDRVYGRQAIYRISHGRTRQVQCQEFLDKKGEGF